MDKKFYNRNRKGKEQVRHAFSEQMGEDISPRVFQVLARPETQTMIMNEVLPWLEQRFSVGIVSDIRLLLGSTSVLVRNVREGNETLYTEPQVLPDVRMVQAELGAMLRSLQNRTVAERGAALAFNPFGVTRSVAPSFSSVNHDGAPVKFQLAELVIITTSFVAVSNSSKLSS